MGLGAPFLHPGILTQAGKRLIIGGRSAKGKKEGNRMADVLRTERDGE
jgi:hypothetical protein